MSGGLNRSSSAPHKNALPPQELLDDLCSRFVLNVPKEDQQSFERILFLVEYAHWFYEDNSVEKNPSLKSLTLKEFTTLLFNNCDVLKPYVAHIDDIFKDFTSYKVRVPVTGAIILDETYERCLLVKGWKGSSWSFPRGKKNKDEEDHKCAVREVLEETGFDFSKFLNKEDYIEMIFGQQRVRLYIVAGVKDDTSFAPQTKKEISEIAWHRLDELQPANDYVISRSMTGLKLYMVAPFLESLKSWISAHPPPVPRRSDKPRKGITVWNAKNSSIGSSSTAAVESQPSKAVADPQLPSNAFPVRSFLNFRLHPIDAVATVADWWFTPQISHHNPHPLFLSLLISLLLFCILNIGRGDCGGLRWWLRRLCLLLISLSSTSGENFEMPNKKKYHLAFLDDEDVKKEIFCKLCPVLGLVVLYVFFSMRVVLLFSFLDWTNLPFELVLFHLNRHQPRVAWLFACFPVLSRVDELLLEVEGCL